MTTYDRKLVMFLDSVNRTIIAEPAKEDTTTTVSMQNPAIINISFDQNGKMVLQLIPVSFRELLKNKNHKSIFHYVRSQITMSNIETEFTINSSGKVSSDGGLEEGIIQQYVKMFTEITVIETPKIDLTSKE